MSLCEYCGDECSPTREHIIPEFLYEYQKESSNGVIGWSDIAKKSIGAEQKIKDVCVKCNNGRLADLDGYAKKFLVDNGFLTQLFTRKKSHIVYDYDLLLRWLMKVSYNSSRCSNLQSHLFKPFIPYILDGCELENKNDVFLAAQVLKPVQYSATEAIERRESGLPISEYGEFNPFMVRISWLAYSNFETSNFKVRANIFGAIVFYIIIFDKESLPGFRKTAVRKFIKNLSNAVEIDRTLKAIKINTSNLTFLDMYEGQIKRQLHFEPMTS
ncbi:hypothetical protein [Aeromonas hydrophila]|uniref:hypothetical protein n=1 Tax=Aeromonas hydrophila TaxID=644 RepID=UPI002B471316|nr:hypothetical protein [Aeromonas hydrophila]